VVCDKDTKLDAAVSREEKQEQEPGAANDATMADLSRTKQ
jgi:hypothetical protein